MQRKLARSRPVLGLAAVTLTAVSVSLAGCGSSGSGTAGASASPTSSGSAPGDSLALSHMKVLTKLKRAQLCGVLTASTAKKILGVTPAAPVYASKSGLGITCQWIKPGGGPTSPDQLYVGISSILSWTGARAVGKTVQSTKATVDGHSALTVDKQAKMTWAQVDVALGGDHDPVAEYRAPTLASALAMAKAATPVLLAQG
jgi:hypothetical protein